MGLPGFGMITGVGLVVYFMIWLTKKLNELPSPPGDGTEVPPAVSGPTSTTTMIHKFHNRHIGPAKG
ncbi:hypothetical protein HF086_011290 [Spodoptera exigua]|uniref:Uncharacterized protein n=1 Tax=Spodoptera exigua TaxID=7107 RepID=A0A922SN00_SPOEX|nr:hypothetical protein HF086_011290 [Spodoptera exigua]